MYPVVFLATSTYLCGSLSLSLNDKSSVSLSLSLWRTPLQHAHTQALQRKLAIFWPTATVVLHFPLRYIFFSRERLWINGGRFLNGLSVYISVRCLLFSWGSMVGYRVERNERPCSKIPKLSKDLSFKPAVRHNIALNASQTTRNFFLSEFSHSSWGDLMWLTGRQNPGNKSCLIQLHFLNPLHWGL